MATVVRSFAIQGIDGYPVDIEIKMLEGQPSISIIGLGDQAVKEAAERIQAAIDESGYVFPKKRVIISLAPSDKKKSGSHFDLAMAVGVLEIPSGSDPNVVNLSPEWLNFQHSGLIFWILYINILTYPPKYVVYRLSNITLPAKYLSIPILRRYAI